MANATIQNNIKKNDSSNLKNYALFLGGLDVTRDVLKQYDPFKTGFARIFMIRKPEFVNKMLPQQMRNFKHIIEYANTGVSGIADIEMEQQQIMGGFAGRSFSIPTVATDSTQNITISTYEFSGSPVRELLHYWITGVSDLQSAFSTYHGCTELEVRQSNHTAEFIYVVTDQTGQASYGTNYSGIEYVCLFANCFPTNIKMDHLNYRAGEHNIVEMDINFTCTKYESPQINAIGKTLLEKHKILMDSLNFNPKIADSDTNNLGTSDYNSDTGQIEWKSETQPGT